MSNRHHLEYQSFEIIQVGKVHIASYSYCNQHGTYGICLYNCPQIRWVVIYLWCDISFGYYEPGIVRAYDKAMWGSVMGMEARWHPSSVRSNISEGEIWQLGFEWLILQKWFCSQNVNNFMQPVVGSAYERDMITYVGTYRIYREQFNWGFSSIYSRQLVKYGSMKRAWATTSSRNTNFRNRSVR